MTVSTPARPGTARKSLRTATARGERSVSARADRLAGARVERPTHAPDAGLSPTAQRMLDAAEKLFAERGLDVVSLREIVAASGQRNLSAAQYHFGSRESLLAMLLARRLYAINVLRHARLDALEAAGLGDDVGRVVGESLRVLADVVREQSWGPDYVCVTAQVLLHPSALAIHESIEPVYLSGHLRVRERLAALLPKLPPHVFRHRLRIVNNEIVYSLARWVRLNGRVTSRNRTGYDALVDHVAEFLAAGMRAPVAGLPPGAPSRTRRRAAARSPVEGK